MSGQRGILITAMFLKYRLASTKMTRAEQLETLEGLDGLPYGDVTSEAIAEIEPCSHEVARMIMEALDLPPAQPWHKLSAGWKLLETEPVWSKLVELNPSLERAQKLFSYSSRKAA
jgi:hypothetical protein